MLKIVITCLFAVCAFAQDNQQIPPFLQGASPDVINSFKQIIASAPQHTDSQMEQLIDNWASQQSPQIFQAFTQFKQQLIAAEQTAEQKHQAALAKLSPAAKEADARLTAIEQDQTMTGAQKQQSIQQIISSLSEQTKQELENAYQNP